MRESYPGRGFEIGKKKGEVPASRVGTFGFAAHNDSAEPERLSAAISREVHTDLQACHDRESPVAAAVSSSRTQVGGFDLKPLAFGIGVDGEPGGDSIVPAALFA